MRFARKVAVVVAVSTFPLYVIKYVKAKTLLLLQVNCCNVLLNHLTFLLNRRGIACGPRLISQITSLRAHCSCELPARSILVDDFLVEIDIHPAMHLICEDMIKSGFFPCSGDDASSKIGTYISG